MTKCYIAGKISGIPLQKAKDNFFAAELEVDNLKYQPVNPLNLPHRHDKKWASYMKECIAALTECDLIYMLVGWGESEGAKLEFDLANKLGITILYQDKN